MSIIRERIKDVAVSEVRGNPSYMSGVCVDVSSVISSWENSEWVKSTSGVSEVDRMERASKTDQSKSGVAVYMRSADGIDTRTLINPKISTSMYSSSTGKLGANPKDASAGSMTEVELTFPNGRAEVGTVVASRCTEMSKVGTLTGTETAPAPQVDASGKTVKEPAEMRKNAQNANSTTGTVLLFAPAILATLIGPLTTLPPGYQGPPVPR